MQTRLHARRPADTNQLSRSLSTQSTAQESPAQPACMTNTGLADPGFADFNQEIPSCTR